jgi:ABC-2 type transport system permease protein
LPVVERPSSFMFLNPTTIRALIRRDGLVVRSYRLGFVLEVSYGVLDLALYFFISRTFEGFSATDLGSAPTYFAFAAVGIVVGVVLDATSSSVGYRVREEQVTGTLEALSTAPVRPLELSLGLVGFPFAFASLRAGFYLIVAATLMDLDVSNTSWPGLGLVLLASGAALAPIGILAAAAVLVFKRGHIISATIVYLMTILGGMVFPVSVLPDWIEPLASVVPLTYAFDGARDAFFAGSGWGFDVLVLTAWAVLLWPIAVFLLGRASAFARRAGSLSEY